MLAWIILFTTPFFFNYVLFDPALFSDQRGYINFISYIRENGYSGIDLTITGIEKLRTFGLESSVILYSLIPMPMNLTITSIAFMNKLLMFFYMCTCLETRTIEIQFYYFYSKHNSLFLALTSRSVNNIFFKYIYNFCYQRQNIHPYNLSFFGSTSKNSECYIFIISSFW